VIVTQAGKQGVVSHAREAIGKIREPKAEALFETTAEVCTGLIKAYDDCESRVCAQLRVPNRRS